MLRELYELLLQQFIASVVRLREMAVSENKSGLPCRSVVSELTRASWDVTGMERAPGRVLHPKCDLDFQPLFLV